MDLSTMHVHFVGVGGAGMSGIAKILLEMGVRVSGSDLTESFRTQRLKDLGAEIFIGHRAENIKRPDLVVISSAVPISNVEVAEARQNGIPIIGRAEMLGRLMNERIGVAVAGTHGKTTTTSMVSLILEEAGLDPTVVVGGELNDIGSNAKLGRGPHLVAEADESDASFLKLCPQFTIVTNIEADHLEHYHSLEAIVSAFQDFLNLLPSEGAAVLNCEDPNLAELIHKLQCRVVTYGRGRGDITPKDVELHPLGSSFSVVYKGSLLGRIRLMVPGMHNVMNALAAIGISLELGAKFTDAVNALGEFTGVQRRFQVMGEKNGILIVDDYAHHPTEVRATLAAARQLGRRVIVVFQPHRYTRTKFLEKDFASCFNDADEVVITGIYSAHESPIIGITAERLARQVAIYKGEHVRWLESKEMALHYLIDQAKPGDLVLTMGAGDIWVVGESLLKYLASPETVKGTLQAAGAN